MATRAETTAAAEARGDSATRLNDEGGPRRRDTWTVKTMLRPDYYEFFPRFPPHEMAERLRRMPFHLATLLTEWNIRAATTAHCSARKDFHSFLCLPVNEQRNRLVDVLESVGIPERVLKAIAKVDRARYLPRRHVSWAYLNAHVPAGAGTCLSPPGTVAIMLGRLPLEPGMSVVEFGAGSGYHLSCALELTRPGGRAVGVDLCDMTGVAGRDPGLRVVVGDLERPPLGGGTADVVFCTCYRVDAKAPLSRVVREGGVLQVIEPVDEAEFSSEPPHSWLAGRYGSHDEYLGSRRQLYACVREYKKSHEGTLIRVGVLYDVSFVSARRATEEPLGIRIPDFGL